MDSARHILLSTLAIAICGAARLPSDINPNESRSDNALPSASVAVDSSVELLQDGPAAVEPSFRPTHRVLMEVTAYCACQKCCGPNASGITASGHPVTFNLGRFVAADTSVLPFGSHVRIPGYHDGEAVPVLDRGGAIKGNHLDVFFPSHRQALDWGRRWVMVEVE